MLVYDELNWMENHQRAERVLGKVTVVHGVGDMVESFQKCMQAATTQLFVMIDGDNWVLDSAKNAIDAANEPTQFFSTNQFGIKYGHGGIKVIDATAPVSGLAVDVTERLQLPVTPVVISVHAFDYSPYSQWRTIFKELLKLHLWGNGELLGYWLKHALVQSIWTHHAQPYLMRSTIDEVSRLLLNNTGLLIEYKRALTTECMFSLSHMMGNPCDVEGY